MKKGCGTVLVILGIIIVAFIILAIVLANTVGKESLSKTKNDNNAASDNPTIQLIIDATDMSLENATEAYNAFKAISDGISVVYSVTYDELLDDIETEGSKGYRIKTEFSKNVILNVLDGKIYSIRYLNYDYYIDGKVNGYFYDRNGKFIATNAYYE